MTLRLRFGVAGAVILIMLVLLVTILPSVVTTSQISQVDQQLLEALPRALVVVKGTLPTDHSTLPKKLPLGVSTTERFSDIYIAEVNSKGRHVLVSLGSGGAQPRLPTVVYRTTNSRPAISTVSSLTGSVRWRALLVRNASGTETLVAVSLAAVDATDTKLHLALFVAGITFVLIVAALWWWLVRLGLKPIAEVTTVADAIAAGDRSRRVSAPHPGSEAAHLARAFNVMLDEEQAVEDRLRRFIADASHELRTPVTVIQGVAELWRQGALHDHGAIDEALRRVGQEGARMAALVADLLLLARLDEGHPFAYEPVDLSRLSLDVLDGLLSAYPTRYVVTEIDPDVTTTGDETQLRQVLNNLITNAFAHTPSGTRVWVGVHREGEQAILEVADDGPGMESANATRAFERFWRASTARSGSGSGLGLAIVAGIVTSHHGSVDLTTAPGNGTKVQVILPLTPNDPH